VAKKLEVVKTDSLSVLEINQDQRDYATAFGLDLNATPAKRWCAAVDHQEASKRHFAAMGLLMLSLKMDLPHGEFQAAVEERRFELRQVRRSMHYARFVFSRPKAEQIELLKLEHTKVCALAEADPDVVDALFEQGDISDLADMGVLSLRKKLQEERAKSFDLAVQRDAAEAKSIGLVKQLNRRSRDEDGGVVPMVVADLRLEMAALFKKAELVCTSLYPLGVEVLDLHGHDEGGQWVAPTLRLGVAGLLALREQVDGLVNQFVNAMGDKAVRLSKQPDTLAFLDDSEIKAVAEEYARLTAAHSHEGALREHERAAAKPRGKGRPAKAPEAGKA
jgi:hypothetical protein